VLIGLVLATLTLLSIHVALQVYHYEFRRLPWLMRQFFDVDEEDSLPTWFATSLHLLTAALLYLIARRKRAERDSWTGYWYGLSFVFVALSMDEIAGLHETINSVTSFSWVIPGAIAATIFGLVYIRFLWRLPPRTRWLFILSGCVFLGGALGVERATDWYKDADQLNTLAYNLWNAVEEGMEMSGVVLFIHAVLGYMGAIRNTPETSQVDIIVAPPRP
jgi:hypothetical protein